MVIVTSLVAACRYHWKMSLMKKTHPLDHIFEYRMRIPQIQMPKLVWMTGNVMWSLPLQVKLAMNTKVYVTISFVAAFSPRSLVSRQKSYLFFDTPNYLPETTSRLEI